MQSFGKRSKSSRAPASSIALAPPKREGEVSAQLQLTESLGTALGAGAGGALLALSGQLGLSVKEANGIFFAVALGAALLGALLADRLSPSGAAVALALAPSNSVQKDE